MGGILTIFAAVFGLLAAVRALRDEEEAGRIEVVLAGVAGRRTVFLGSLERRCVRRRGRARQPARADAPAGA
ncbi:MAG: hypothetical protein WBP81_37760 [Solirubrobacteraceae bacterium]